MNPLLITVLAGFATAGYFYVGKPIKHEVKKASHEICHVFTLGEKCKSEKATTKK